MSGLKNGGTAYNFDKIYFTKILADTIIRMMLPRDYYFWRVRAIDSLGNHSEWSKPFALNAGSIVTNQVIQINNPNSNSNWLVGSTQDITWTSANVDNVKIDYCTDSYITFVNISPSTPAVSNSYKWIVPNITTKQCALRIADVTDGSIYSISWFNIVQATNIKDEHAPNVFELAQNFPNPFNPATSFNYSLPKECKVIVSVYNILGQELTKLIDEVRPPGYYSINWNAGNFSSGVYIYKIEAIPINGDNSFRDIKKMVLLK
jgi:hypothetical protein